MGWIWWATVTAAPKRQLLANAAWLSDAWPNCHYVQPMKKKAFFCVQAAIVTALYLTGQIFGMQLACTLVLHIQI